MIKRLQDGFHICAVSEAGFADPLITFALTDDGEIRDLWRPREAACAPDGCQHRKIP